MKIEIIADDNMPPGKVLMIAPRRLTSEECEQVKAAGSLEKAAELIADMFVKTKSVVVAVNVAEDVD